MDYYGAMGTYSRIGLLRSYGNLQSYSSLSSIAKKFDDVSILALTATATKKTKSDICKNLEIKTILETTLKTSGEDVKTPLETSGEDVRFECILRDNLNVVVKHAPGARTPRQAVADLLEFIRYNLIHLFRVYFFPFSPPVSSVFFSSSPPVSSVFFSSFPLVSSVEPLPTSNPPLITVVLFTYRISSSAISYEAV